MGTSCAKQSDLPKYVAHVLRGPDQRNISNSTNYYDTAKYVERIRRSRVKDINTSS